eukprot:TRINITY_DN1014_c0_g1_i3.p1 TRINITY_DN1014_c0_g1~~TRINITY_DN1014_c0_g1_i3.p1  ORF type:complete len:519 (+),score=287.39 TRINITY_DN1014_c0_g1_i3:63-1619(+)
MPARLFSDSEDEAIPTHAMKRSKLNNGRAYAREEPSSAFQTKLFINNQFVDAQEGATFETVNPATGDVICTVAEAREADVNLAVKAAQQAQDGWRRTTGPARRDLLLKLADLIEENLEELATLETLDNGKPLGVSKAVDLPLVVKCFRYYAGWADKVTGQTNPVEGDFFSYTKVEPKGICAAVIPWNFPLLMAAWKLAPGLATGNCMIVKPAEQTPLTALRLAELIKAAGFPAGVVAMLPGFGPSCGGVLAKHMEVDKIGFTGSTAVGHIIMKDAAESNLKSVTLELGGKSPLVICEDADMDEAVAAAQVGVFFNQGQVCTASSRIFVHESIHDEFVAKLVAATKQRTQGNPFEDVMMGPQVSQEQFDIVNGYIAKGKAQGARLACGGKKTKGKGYYIQPTIFTEVSDDMTIAKEEIFGPVMSILKYSDFRDAIKRANDSKYGLAAGIFTRDINKAFEYADDVEAGTVWVNTYNSFDTAQGFGGYKMSGLGRELGPKVLDAYTETKAVMVKLGHKKGH